MNEQRRAFTTGLVALAASSTFGVMGVARAGSRTLFVRSAVENADGTATLPLYRGSSRGRTLWFVLLDSSDGSDADRLGVNKAQKLAIAAGTQAVQRVRFARSATRRTSRTTRAAATRWFASTRSAARSISSSRSDSATGGW